MGRNRKQRIVNSSEPNVVLEMKDSEGFYPYRLCFDVRCRLGKVTRVFLGNPTQNETVGADAFIGRDGTTFHHLYSQKHPDLCKELAIVASTIAMDSCHSKSMIAYSLRAISTFLEFIDTHDKAVTSLRDVDFDVMVEYRAYIRSSDVSQNSKYKGNQYHPIKALLERVHGTSRGTAPYKVPLYQTDASDPLSTYSDMVIYEIIACAIHDCDQIMAEVSRFEELTQQGTVQERRGQTRRWTIENFAWFLVNVMGLLRPPYSQADRAKYKMESYATRLKQFHGMSFNKLVMSRSDEQWRELAQKGGEPRNFNMNLSMASLPDIASTWRDEASFLTHGLEKLGEHNVRQNWRSKPMLERADVQEFMQPPFSSLQLGWALTEREIATRDTLLPFLLLFALYTGRNTEVIYRWRRVNSKGFSILSLEHNQDPLEQNSIVIEGWKWRGKRTHKEKDNVIIPTDDILFKYLQFIVKYTQPLADHIGSDDLWLYLGLSSRVEIHSMEKNHLKAIKDFCQRHTIYDEEGERITNIDIRRFRKVFITHELLSHLNEHSSLDELANDLREKMHHKKFDTTLSKYLINDVTNQTLDAGILVLQEQFLEEAKAYCTLMDNASPNDARIGINTIQARCEDPEVLSPDGRIHNCDDYDFCLGCKRSRVYVEHLPRICARLIQYEEKKARMPEDEWKIKYEKKQLRGKDALIRWRNAEQVANAWDLARAGKVPMPVLY